MAVDDKQNNLNGGFYGPSIPPPTNTTLRGASGSSSCLCNFFCIIFKIILALVIIVGLLILILWLVYRPLKLKFHVTDAALTQFDLSDSNILKYNLAVNISARNPNKRVVVYYEKIEVNAYYAEQRFGSASLNGFYQGTKNTTVWSPVLHGQSLLVLNSPDALTYFDAQKSNGIYSISLKVLLGLKYEYGTFKSATMTPKVECYFNVPLSGYGSSYWVSFKETNCLLLST
uniref:Late embryogenesis abundant protein LEA-2 subgroup domain-containing protein n=1 Tax=Kalanchoe fedtschenkoi TaxID=63787 RepID=A0A7N0UWL8_KALFE